MARKVVKNGKKDDNFVSKRVITPKKHYLYSHLYLNESPKAALLEKESVNFPFKMEVSVAPSGCKSYRIPKEEWPKMYRKRGSLVNFLPVPGKETEYPLQEEDIFWYLHSEWNTLTVNTPEIDMKTRKTKK